MKKSFVLLLFGLLIINVGCKKDPENTSNTIIPSCPAGAINSLFSVSSSKKVFFSQGNLQYQASTNTWRFADNQWDYIGWSNQSISPSYGGWIDLFGWGTSGYNHGAVCYQPWSVSHNDEDYYAYGHPEYNLYDNSGIADWGYNRISNGSNDENMWRTLSTDEWYYIINTRNTQSGIRYAKANVNGINGVILIPDQFNGDTYNFNTANSGNSSYDSNTISFSDWTNIFEKNGAVFIPITGYRYYDWEVNFIINNDGQYWSSSKGGLHFGNNSLNVSYVFNLFGGRSVRLVHDYK